MSWIKSIEYDEATGKLKAIYDKVKGPNNYLDNILTIHSLRPHTLVGHMSIYKNVLHHSSNTLPVWLLEALGVYVSRLNHCLYCVDHHYQGLKKQLQNDDRAEDIRLALEDEDPERVFGGSELALMRYARVLALAPHTVSEGLINQLRDAGLNDGEILEANQVISYFSYANRTVLGLGVNTDGDILGLSPSDVTDEENWNHQ